MVTTEVRPWLIAKTWRATSSSVPETSREFTESPGRNRGQAGGGTAVTQLYVAANQTLFRVGGLAARESVLVYAGASGVGDLVPGPGADRFDGQAGRRLTIRGFTLRPQSIPEKRTNENFGKIILTAG